MSVDVRARLSADLASLFGVSTVDFSSLLENPPNPEFGDFAVPCFRLARELKKDPRRIAQDLSEKIESARIESRDPGSLIRETRPVGPYLNLFVNRELLIADIVSDTLTGFRDMENHGAGKTVVIDFSSPNIAKPFGIGHLRSTVIGGSLKRIFAALGYRVVGINHLGDWGTQFGKLIAAYVRWGDSEALDRDPIGYLYDLYVRFHREAEKDPALEEEARSYFKRMEHGDQEALSLWREFSDLSLAEFKRIYTRLGVDFEFYTGESFYGDMLEETLKKVKSAGVTESSEGALVVPLSADEPPVLLRKSDGATLYITRDIAAALYRHETFDFDLALYVVGTPQALHFRQLFAILEKMGCAWHRNCHHVGFGQIRFKDSAMSTRKGNIVLLEEVLDRAVERARSIIEEKNPQLHTKEEVAEAVGVGAIIFNDLKNNRIKDITFDWDEAINFSGETGVYLQYTHARIASLVKKYEERNGPVRSDAMRSGDITEDAMTGHGSRISFDDDDRVYGLMVHINEFENTVLRASREYEPSAIARYLLELAGLFNGFYTTHRVISDDAESTTTRILIVLCVEAVLKEGLGLLGIAAPEAM
jgi:arginyl-tRNA synthetase